MAVITEPSTLLRLHHALVKCKYHLLYSSQRPCRPGPKGPSRELIAAVVEMKRLNPRMGCRKIAEQISNAFGFEINKDVVRRILIQHHRPAPGGAGPSWLSVIGQARDSLWSVDLFRCESILLKGYWVMVVMDIFTRRIIGFGVAAANLDGPSVCRMFNRAIVRQSMPKRLSSDHDPLFRFQRWPANLRILEVDEIKSIPCTPRSHAFIERLIGTIRREYPRSDFVLEPRRSRTEARQLQGLLQPISLPHRTGRNHASSARWRACRSICKPRLIPMAKTLQRPLSDPGRRLSCISPHTGEDDCPHCADAKRQQRYQHRYHRSGLALGVDARFLKRALDAFKLGEDFVSRCPTHERRLQLRVMQCEGKTRQQMKMHPGVWADD